MPPFLGHSLLETHERTGRGEGGGGLQPSLWRGEHEFTKKSSTVSKSHPPPLSASTSRVSGIEKKKLVETKVRAARAAPVMCILC